MLRGFAEGGGVDAVLAETLNSPDEVDDVLEARRRVQCGVTKTEQNLLSHLSWLVSLYVPATRRGLQKP